MYVEFYPKRTVTTEHTFGKMTLKDTESYIFHDSWVGTLPGNVALLDNRFRQYNINIDCSNKSILFIRTAGGGDMLFLSSIISYIKNKYENVKIDFCCIEEQSEIAKLIKDIDNIIPMPLNSKIFDTYDYHFEISGIIEHNDQNINKNVYDLLFEHLGVTNQDEVSVNYKKPLIKSTINYNPVHKSIGIHPFANDPIRQYDINLINIIIDKLVDNYFEVTIFSSDEEKNIYSPFIHKDAKWFSGRKFPDIINKLSTLETVLCTDSLFLHLCQAINVPTISIHGPFSSESRTKYYTNATIIDTFPSCRCSAHGVGRCPKGFNNSPCLNIDPDMLIDIILNNPVSFNESIPVDIDINYYNAEKLNVEE